jgi:uncharacterized membrane-anchored protein YhcB (DUF1043 family)
VQWIVWIVLLVPTNRQNKQQHAMRVVQDSTKTNLENYCVKIVPLVKQWAQQVRWTVWSATREGKDLLLDWMNAALVRKVNTKPSPERVIVKTAEMASTCLTWVLWIVWIVQPVPTNRQNKQQHATRVVQDSIKTNLENHCATIVPLVKQWAQQARWTVWIVIREPTPHLPVPLNVLRVALDGFKIYRATPRAANAPVDGETPLTAQLVATPFHQGRTHWTVFKSFANAVTFVPVKTRYEFLVQKVRTPTTRAPFLAFPVHRVKFPRTKGVLNAKNAP